MSAYKQFDEVQFANAEILVQALKELGYEVEIGKSLTLYGFMGKARPETAQIVVRRQQIGEASNDLGFAWNGAAFNPIISEFDAGRQLNEEWRQRLQFAYSRIATLRFLRTVGADVQHVAQNEQGLIIRAQVEVKS